MRDLSDYWPKSLQHLRAPYDDSVSEHVVIAEFSDAPREGYQGQHTVTTALVPLADLEDVLRFPGGIGWKVDSWGPQPVVDKGHVYNTSFWIEGRGDREERFQTIINSWTHHDREVHLPDNVLLMAYGLVPRVLTDGTTCWDDPQGPVYEVLRVKPYVDHSKKDAPQYSQITIRRDYLEDYCSLKGAAAVAVYFEERYSAGDETFEPTLEREKDVEFLLPGRRLWMKLLGGSDNSAAPQYSCEWGCRLILSPSRRPISDAQDPVLTWPGDAQPMSAQRAAREWVDAYVSDEVLCEYESRDEYEIFPEYGGVKYGGWWGTDRTRRFGRNHIRIELKKLYEGCPPNVVAHWHRYAVLAAAAELDEKTNGSRNIATRTQEVIEGYLRLTEVLELVSDALGTGFTQKEIGSFNTREVRYSGWWTMQGARSLFAVARLTATKEQFLARAMALFKLLENLKPGPLRNLVLKLGIPKEKLKDMGSIKLLAALSQLAMLAQDEGLSLVEDSLLLSQRWNPDTRLPFLASLFAINGLRVCNAHSPGHEQDQKIASAASQLGIDVNSTRTGWGRAIDAMYDRLVSDLSSLTQLLAAGLAKGHR